MLPASSRRCVPPADAPALDEPVNQYSSLPRDLPTYDHNGNLTRIDPQASGGFGMMMMGQSPDPNSPIGQGLATAQAAGGHLLDLSGNQIVDAGDGEIISQIVIPPDDGGGGEPNPTLYLPRAAVIRYDYRNQMVENDYTDTSEMTALHLFHYDCFGRRVRKVSDVVRNSAGEILSGTETRHINGGPTMWEVLEEQDAAYSVLATYIYGVRIDEVLSMRRGGQDYYYHADDLGSIVALTDDTGAVVETHTYGDYGLPDWFGYFNSSIGNTRGFTGREWDGEVQLYFYRTRYLEPSWGRFTTRDSISIWGDAANHGNGLAYVGDAPWTQFDPIGEGAMGTSADAAYAEVSYSLSAIGGLGMGGGASGGLQVMGNCRSRELSFFLFMQAGVFVGTPGVSSTANFGGGLLWHLPRNHYWAGLGGFVGLNVGWSATDIAFYLTKLGDTLSNEYGVEIPNGMIRPLAEVLKRVPRRGGGGSLSGVVSFSRPYYPTGIEFVIGEGLTSGVSASAGLSWTWQIGSTYDLPYDTAAFICDPQPAKPCPSSESQGALDARGQRDLFDALIKAGRRHSHEIEQEWLYTPMGAMFFDPFGGSNVPY